MYMCECVCVCVMRVHFYYLFTIYPLHISSTSPIHTLLDVSSDCKAWKENAAKWKQKYKNFVSEQGFSYHDVNSDYINPDDCAWINGKSTGNLW